VVPVGRERIKRKGERGYSRWRLGYISRKAKLPESKNLPETLEPYLGNSDCF
jgi:hypothetical protein